MKKYKNLPDILTDGKLIPRNFQHIGHLAGSRMINNEDKLVGIELQNACTKSLREPKYDKVYVLEKIDGMNAGVVKINEKLYPINKKGYDVRLMGKQNNILTTLADAWATWVDNNYDTYNYILEDGQRLVFENCIVKHTLRYHFKDDPVFLLAIYLEDGTRLNYERTFNIAENMGIQMPPLVNAGIAISPEELLKQYPKKGLCGCAEQMEGFVYTYEHNGKYEASVKYVANTTVGTIGDLTLKYYNDFKYSDKFNM